MAFSLEDVRKVVAAFDSSDWDEIHISADGSELHLISVEAAQRGVTASAVRVPEGPRPVAKSESSDGTQRIASVPMPAGPRAVPAPAALEGGVVVTAPSVGVFYCAPSPGAPPFVHVGDCVQPDTTVGIVEVMKLMNPVAAGTAGTIVAIHPANAEMVEKGQPLVTIAPSGG
jgi:acetyl-CoA carboxylase biotin carboxyl carrier protein